MGKLVLKRMERQDAAKVRPQAGTEVTIGVDLSRTKWVCACVWGGEVRRRVSLPGELRHLQALVREYVEAGCQIRVAYEACGFGYEIAWWLESQGIEVVVVAPCTVEKAPGRQVKTDGLDASGLACKAALGVLKRIFVPRRPTHQERQLSRTYGQLLGDRRRQQIRLRLLLQEHGLIAPGREQGWSAFEQWLTVQELAAPVRRCVDELCQLRASSDGAVRRLQTELRKVATQPEYADLVRALAEQPGVGVFTAIRFVLEIGDIGRFRNADSLSNYLGLTPNEYSSGEMVHRGHVRKCGPAPLRSWLVQCAWIAVRRGGDERLRECFEKLAPRAGRKKAIIAVARRLALRLRARWIEQESQAQRLAA